MPRTPQSPKVTAAKLKMARLNRRGSGATAEEVERARREYRKAVAEDIRDHGQRLLEELAAAGEGPDAA